VETTSTVSDPVAIACGVGLFLLAGLNWRFRATWEPWLRRLPGYYGARSASIFWVVIGAFLLVTSLGS
jgi:hypothetical protein